ncbi:hypothetical protein [Streptomyces sp. NPDC048436]|uniref:hypothetical protein n=1 Tax=Streptomyces sp. NPDC048436 TaxID=3365550 RepID=UPI00371F37C3
MVARAAGAVDTGTIVTAAVPSAVVNNRLRATRMSGSLVRGDGGAAESDEVRRW